MVARSPRVDTPARSEESTDFGLTPEIAHDDRFATLSRSMQLLLMVMATLLGAHPAVAGVRVRNATTAWTPVTLEIDGPESREDGPVNPFRDIRLLVTFRSESSEVVVPGYFAADGRAGETGAEAGAIWRAHLVPDRPGVWTYQISMRGGKDIALSDDPEAGRSLPADGQFGTFSIEPAEPGTSGLLGYDGTRYLRFANSGRRFLKTGADSPENFLAYAEFDGATVGSDRIRRPGEAAPGANHVYKPHIPDWRDGDPTWRDGRGKGIIGALNYLADQGVNSVYFLTMNIRGDGRDVWPFLSNNPNDRDRYDCSKLDQWEIVFDHMDRLGLMLHVILTETENESLFEFQSPDGPEIDFAPERALYYRELIARFGHHRAIVWNLGEENGGGNQNEVQGRSPGRSNTDAQRIAFARRIRAIDPYDRPIVVHTYPGQYDKIYSPLLGNPYLDGPSLQIGNAQDVHRLTLEWIKRSSQSGRSWFVCFDELGPAKDGVLTDAEDPEHDDVRALCLWGNLMAGGAGVEWYFGYQHPHNDLNLEDFRSRQRMWDQSRIAREFFEEHLPFASMEADDDLLRLDRGDGYALAKPGLLYAAYLKPGSRGAELWLPEADYAIRWFDPRNGGDLVAGSQASVTGGGFRSLGDPPSERDRDWLALVRLDGEPPAEVPEPPRPETPQISGLTWIDVETGRAIGPLRDGDVVDRAQLPEGIALRAEVPERSGAEVARVVFDWQGTTKAESVAPYALAGDTQGKFNPLELTKGAKTLTVRAEGPRGPSEPLTVRFRVE